MKKEPIKISKIMKYFLEKTKAFIHDTLNLSINLILHEHAGQIFIEEKLLFFLCSLILQVEPFGL